MASSSDLIKAKQAAYAAARNGSGFKPAAGLNSHENAQLKRDYEIIKCWHSPISTQSTIQYPEPYVPVERSDNSESSTAFLTAGLMEDTILLKIGARISEILYVALIVFLFFIFFLLKYFV